MENNVVTVAGWVREPGVFSHRVYGEGFYRLVLGVPRLSAAEDLLPVTVSERLAAGAALAAGAPLTVTGQLRSYNRFDGERSRLVLTVFAQRLEQQAAEPLPNEIFLDGFLCKPPVYRTTPFGREIADLLLAVNRAYRKSDYIPCIVWGRNARYAAAQPVGTHLRLWGRVQSRRYTKRREDGVEERMAYEVSAAKLEVGDGMEPAETEEKS